LERFTFFINHVEDFKINSEHLIIQTTEKNIMSVEKWQNIGLDGKTHSY